MHSLMSTNNEDMVQPHVQNNLLIAKHASEECDMILLLPSLIFIYVNICKMGMIIHTLFMKGHL
jgi:hypothetical protein